MKKHHAIAIAAIVIIAVLLSGLIVFRDVFSNIDQPPKTYVGIAFCGDTVAQGKILIDKVKSYTNLFVLQSGLLQRDYKSVVELGDYAVAAGMYFLPYFGNFIQETFDVWLKNAQQRWGTHLLGVYYSDEPGGKMLDDYVEYKDQVTGNVIEKTKYGDIFVTQPNGVMINYDFDANIHLYEPAANSDVNNEETFYPNGTISIVKASLKGFSYQNYKELQDVRPFKDVNETAQRFVERDKDNINFLVNRTKVFTSDYGLYWFDYLSGYDVILGQIGWNISLNQQISFLRGAATTQSKDWGVVITWKYQEPPYLDSPSQIQKQLTISYECGAKYLVVFDYYTSNQSQYGTMTQEHFNVLESFWKTEVSDHNSIQGSIKVDIAVVLPPNYGYGARWEEDKIWGIFKADSQTEEVWSMIQSTLQDHGFQTDIIFASKYFPLPQTYSNLTYAT